MKERIVRIKVRIRDPKQPLDEIRQVIETSRDHTTTSPAPPDVRESVLPDEQLETKLQPELQKFLDDLDASTETEESVASRPNYLTDSRTASEFTADFRIGAHLDRRFPVHVFDRALGWAVKNWGLTDIFGGMPRVVLFPKTMGCLSRILLHGCDDAQVDCGL